MNRDELTYSRATTAALAGLAVQIVLCVATGLIGAWAQSPAIQAATWHIAGGIPIWIILAIIYQQHRVERTESLAAESSPRKTPPAPPSSARRATNCSWPATGSTGSMPTACRR